MEVEFKISKEELIDFHMKYIANTTIFKYQMISNFIFNFMVFLLIIFCFKDPLYRGAGLITLFVMLLFRKRIFRHKLRKKFFKIYSFDKYKNLFEQTNLTFTEDGLKTSTKFSEKVYKWDSIKSIHLVENYIFIRTVNNEDLLFSALSFNPIENKELFLDTITKNTKLEIEKEYPKDVKYL
ncbi:YcxB family protein [Clostridium sp. ZBS14]|uniref:YcxB family protein n=1 Tax=Clostridium sp. ZBS14 TaxID=2949970 RepID=UPI00207ACFDA|nr:YcxB family protein [Clostridium sp. ZBS14]